MPFDPDQYTSMGESIMRALIDYRACLKQIENELIETKGWLKPKLLLEVTGTPAAKKIADEQELQRRKELKQQKIEQYQQAMRQNVKSTRKKELPIAGKQDSSSPEKTRNTLVRNETEIRGEPADPVYQEGQPKSRLSNAGNAPAR